MKTFSPANDITQIIWLHQREAEASVYNDEATETVIKTCIYEQNH